MFKGLLLILIGFMVGIAVTGKRVLPPQSNLLVPPANGATPATNYATSGVTDGGT